MAQDKGALEKKDLKIGFIPIHLRHAAHHGRSLGFYRKQGLNVTLNKTAGWALIRDKMLNKEHDASHFLSPMPLAISLGLGSAAQAMNVATIQNINGQAITLHVPSTRTSAIRNNGKVSGLPYPSTTRCTISCCATTSPSTASIRTPTSRSASRRRRKMVANLRAGNIDGFLGPDPFKPACGLRRGRLHPHSVQGALGRASLLRFRRIGRVHQGESNTFAAL